jgi:hypothetical protein
MTQEILPPTPEPTLTPALFTPEELPPEFAFTPVPRKRARSNGITPLKQATFIMHLVGCGNVEKAAMAVGSSGSAFYQLRKAEGAESFAAAWAAAIDTGSRRVLDTLMEHAIYGVPETIIKDGQVILERRKFNTRAMMWIVQQRFPEQFGGTLNMGNRPESSLPDGLRKLKEEWRKEWEEEAAAARAEASDAEAAALNTAQATTTRILKKYAAKVREEYHFRSEGNAIAADFALRQLTHIEVVMDVAGVSYDVIKAHFHNAPHGGPWSTWISRKMEEARHEAWAQVSGEDADWYDRDVALDDGVGGDPPEGPPPIRYTRPALPHYLTETDLHADEADRAEVMGPGNSGGAGNWRTRLAREQAWEETRQTESGDVGEEPTFLPRG